MTSDYNKAIWSDDPIRVQIDGWIEAISEGDTKRVLDYLDSGIDVNIGDAIGTTGLAFAIHHGHHDLIRLLLARGAKTDVANSMCYTPLTTALRSARPFPGSNRTPDDLPLQILLAAGARYRLYEAVLLDDVPLARQRLEEGADPNYGKGSYDGPVLKIAAENGQLGIVRLLLDFGAKIEATDDLGRRPLLSAAYYGQAEVVALLLDRGAEINARDWSGQTAASEAALAGHRALYDLLLSRGAEPGIVDALVLDDQDLFVELLDEELGEGRDIDWISDGRQRLAKLAIERGNAAIVGLLLDRGSENLRDFEDHSLLAQAAKHGQIEIARLLIGRGADLHAAGRDGLTALAWALRAGQEEAVAFLRSAGATH